MVKTGLIAADIVSKWTWAATLLQSSNVAWNYGVSGPFWYASGATIQVILFGVLAISLKDVAPSAHTMCEIARARWGKTAHLTFLFFGFCSNIVVTAMLILGGAATVEALCVGTIRTIPPSSQSLAIDDLERPTAALHGSAANLRPTVNGWRYQYLY